MTVDLSSFTGIEPTFTIHENDMPDLGNVKQGQRLKLFINFKVIEKTRSFTMLRMNSIQLLPARKVV